MFSYKLQNNPTIKLRFLVYETVVWSQRNYMKNFNAKFVLEISVLALVSFIMIGCISYFCPVKGHGSNGTLSGITIVLSKFCFLKNIHYRKESGFVGEMAD